MRSPMPDPAIVEKVGGLSEALVFADLAVLPGVAGLQGALGRGSNGRKAVK